MTPFREKAVKWDGDSGNGRYKNKKGFKFDIITKSVVCGDENMPDCFLADTPEEAQAIYAKFESLLNGLAYSYAVSTNLNRSDLFGEGLIGLARAYRDWDSGRSNDFRSYAIYKIKDALNECVRKNASAISVPAYIKKSHSNLQELKAMCEKYSTDWRSVVSSQTPPSKFIGLDKERCEEIIENLKNASTRSKVEYKKFVERIEFIPQDVDYTDQVEKDYNGNQQRLEAALVVDRIKSEMDEEEKKICDGIMLGKTYEKIGEEFGKSKAWVAGKLKEIRERVISKLGNDAM